MEIKNYFYKKNYKNNFILQLRNLLSYRLFEVRTPSPVELQLKCVTRENSIK